jgi:UDP-glucose 4-epimerase
VGWSQLRILFTGASSFTGMWFAGGLARRGHSVTAVGRSEQSAYSGLRSERLARVADCCRTLWNAPFGSSHFLEIIAEEGPFDMLCHHGAETAGYRSKEFDCVGGVAANTQSIQAVVAALRIAGCGRIVLTGSIFEAGEGAGTLPLRAFNSYGLSKTLTSQVFEFHAEQEQIALGKFVIPNPFGPYEEPRFTDYLIRSWREGKTALVGTPRLVRDNIHVSLLSECYCGFVGALPHTGFHRINPSGYAETQAAFASRFAREIGARLNLETPLEMARQKLLEEPAIRINKDVIVDAEFEWDERRAWDQLAEYYARRFDIDRRRS